MKSRGFAYSDTGRKREDNEDAFYLDDELGVYAVSDGMGGHASGQVAASVAVASVAEAVREVAGDLEEIRAGAQAGHAGLVVIAREAVLSACRHVHELASTKPEYTGMGCTLTVLLVAGNRAAMAHVGDSRLYLQRDGGVDQLSSDHTLAADLVRKAELTPEAARTHPYSNALTRAIGPQPTVQVETMIFDVLPDDVFLLCSDGLSHYMENLGELAPYLTVQDLASSPRILVELANARGGKDNITALVVSVTVPDEERQRNLQENVRQDLASLRKADLFAGIPLAHLLRLHAVSQVRQVDAGDSVLTVGDDVPGMVQVLSGSLRLEARDGRVETLGPGQSFGSPALLQRGSSQVALVAGEASRLLFLDSERFHQLAANRPRVVLTLLSRVAQDILTRLGADGDLLGLHPERRRQAWWNPLAWARCGGWSA